MVAMEVAAEKATLLPRLGSPRQKLRKQASHTGSFESAYSTFRQCRTGQTCANRRFPSNVDVVEEPVSGDSAISGKGKHLRKVKSAAHLDGESDAPSGSYS